jgi:hypothetical protein
MKPAKAPKPPTFLRDVVRPLTPSFSDRPSMINHGDLGAYKIEVGG